MNRVDNMKYLKYLLLCFVMVFNVMVVKAVTTDTEAPTISRIKFEELLKHQLKVRYMFYRRKNNPEGVKIDYNKEKVQAFIDRLPFKLTVMLLGVVPLLVFTRCLFTAFSITFHFSRFKT